MNLQLFYHVAVLGSWNRVVREQIELFRRVGLRPMIGIVGPPGPRLHDAGTVMFHHADVRKFETPTLQRLWEWCLEHPDDAVLYCHTKGVSKPHRPNWTSWRLLMERWVIERWRENLPLLENRDIIGVDYMDRGDRVNFTSHFAGNFWMARCDWIGKLIAPIRHSRLVRPRRRRFSPEMWPLSNPGYRYVSLCCEGVLLGKHNNATTLLKRPIK